MPGRCRRTVALGVLLVTLAAACGADGDGSAAADPTTTTTTVPPTTTSLPPGGRQPTAADPLRVTFAGDSVMAEFAPAMIQALEGSGETAGRFVLAPSLARGGAGGVVWNRELQDHDPDLIVLLLGFWEDEVVGETASDDPGWAQQYRTSVVDPFLDLLTRDGAKVLWIGMPAVVDPAVTERLARLNSVFSDAADSRGDVDYLPGGEYLSGPEGGYTDVTVSSATGRPVRLRRVDGLHLCPGGVDLLGAPVLDEITRQWNVQASYGWQQGTWRQPPLLHAPEECPAPV
ncbi:MAG: hypothetical protein ABWZ13_08270 [Acidimicrobiales bacterium]